MTLLEDLEEAARRVSCSCGGKTCATAPLAARLRVTRLDHEEKWAKDIEALGGVTLHSSLIVQGVLARLDKPVEP